MKKSNIEAVITSYNQGEMILEALYTVCEQTVLPERVLVVDDGSTEETSLEILKNIEHKEFPVPVMIHYQDNAGVSAARNKGISLTTAPFVLVFDGDDRLKPTYIEEVSSLLEKNNELVAASSWMQTFGVLESIVKPTGGEIAAFLSANRCPATHIVRREEWEACGGYDESMRSGFEDWEFFLSILETKDEARIGIVEKPLIEYRTAPASANIKSMSKRLDIMRYMIQKHEKSYHNKMIEALLGLEQTSMTRLNLWEQEVLHEVENDKKMSTQAEQFVKSPSYGDGGMAAAVRIRTRIKGKEL